MSSIFDKAKEIFEKVKPVLMSEVTSNAGLKEEKLEITPEDQEVAVIANIETVGGTGVPVEKAGGMNIVTALINGAGIGLLLGTLLGLAISPVVSGIIATLSGLLAVLLGVSEKYMSPLKSVRIGAFGFFCVAGIIMGMYIRTNRGLLPSRQKMMAEYRAVGFTREEARDFIAFREFGRIPSGWTGETTEATDRNPSQPGDHATSVETESTGEKSSLEPERQIAVNTTRQFVNPGQTVAEFANVLYSSEINAAECYKLNIANSSQPVAEIKNAFERAGGTWKEMAQHLEAGLPENVYILALFSMRDCLCQAGHTGKFKVTMNTNIRKISDGQSLEQIRKTLSDSGGTWKSIVEKISSDIPVEYQKILYLSLIKIFKS